MVKIRLRRMGRRKSPSYRLVATDSRHPRDGRFAEILGYYNPLRNPSEIKIDSQKVFKWLKNGAQPSDAVRNLLRKVGIWEQWSKIKQGRLTVEEVLQQNSEEQVEDIEASA